MSALHGARAAAVAAIKAAAPGVQVSAFPRAEDLALRESIHFTRAASTFDWRCLGPRRTNRREDVTLDGHVHVYREAHSQDDAAQAVTDRADQLLELIENAIADDLTLNDHVAHARVASWSVQPDPAGKGWTARAEFRIEAQNFPTQQ